MSEKEFLVQRYSVANWDAVRGLIPFSATGPRFQEYVIPRSLQTFGEHRFGPVLLDAMRTVMGDLGGDWRDVMAEWLLREGIVQALWSVDSRECLPEDVRWTASVRSLAAEIPKVGPVVDSTVELLSGMSDPGHFRLYLSEDSLSLEPCPVP